MAATTRRSVRQPAEYPITRVLATNSDGTETTRVPGLRFTLDDIQGVMDHRVWQGVLDTVNLFCETCGESVVDCPELRGRLVRRADEWSWESKVGEGF
jgi:hypothetical protein